MKTQHTPAPWSVDITTNDNREAETIRGADNIRIAATYKVHEHRADKTAAWYESRANSKLIAAAPDLLRIVSEMLGAAEIEGADEKSNEWRSLMIDARAAIAKATGDNT